MEYLYILSQFNITKYGNTEYVKGEILFQKSIFSQSHLVSFPKGIFNDMAGTLNIMGISPFNEYLLESIYFVFYFELPTSAASYKLFV